MQPDSYNWLSAISRFSMNSRLLLGSVAAYLYNGLLSHIPAHGFRRCFLRYYLGALGAGTSVQMNCRFLNGRKVFLGRRNVINFGCLFDGRKYTINIGNDVSIGPEATILTLGHDPHSSEFCDRGGDVVVSDHVWIGYRALVLPALKIGEGAVVGAGSVVTKNVEPFAIVAGNPARKIGIRNADLRYQLKFNPFLN